MWITKKLLCIIVGIIGIVIILSMAGGVVATMKSQGVFGVVVIDPGHGGIDGGVTHGELIESHINLEMSIMLKEELERRNFKVVMTRTTDKAIGNSKRTDMEERSKIINDTAPLMMVSMHVNKWRTSNRRGVQVFYDDTGKNAGIAEQMQSTINSYVNNKYSRRTDLKCLGGDYYITKCSPFPSLIVENGFISNPEDRALLTDPKYRKDIILAIANCIVSVAMA